MAKLTIKNPNWGDGSGPTVAQGTEVYLDGEIVDRVTSLTLDITVGEPVAATITVWAMPDEELTLPADVTVITMSLEDDHGA